MAYRRVRLPEQTKQIVDWSALRAELGIVEAFSEEAQRNAEQAPEPYERVDLRHVEFFTLDPAGSMDLDQAMFLEATEDGFRVQYAIADVGAFVRPDTALDAETHTRGESLYCPDKKVPLHPDVLGEAGASLLPDQERPAVVWTLDLDHDANLQHTHVQRATVMSRRKLDYKTLQDTIDAGGQDEQARFLQQIGELRALRAAERGALDFHIPEQIVTLDNNGTPHLSYRVALPAENWNAEISLLTNLAAASLMLEAKVGVLRVLPPVQQHDVDALRISAQALGVDWPESKSLSEWLRELDPTPGKHAALLNLGGRLLRGAAYVAFDGDLPDNVMHSAVAAPYTHCTAPIRRLVDRYVTEVCLAIREGRDIPEWTRTALTSLPQQMAQADQRAHSLERVTIDLAEAFVMSAHIGETFEATVIDRNTKTSTMQIAEPAVRGHVDDMTSELGSTVRVRVESVDLAKRSVILRTV